jgi:hypothetical protein
LAEWLPTTLVDGLLFIGVPARARMQGTRRLFSPSTPQP